VGEEEEEEGAPRLLSERDNRALPVGFLPLPEKEKQTRWRMNATLTETKRELWYL